MLTVPIDWQAVHGALAERWQNRGFQAAMVGEQRNPPTTLHGDFQTLWLKGYDEARQRMEDQR